MDPIHKAIMRHSQAELIQAIKQGHDVDALDPEGRTALFYAVRDGDTEIVFELLRSGANVNVRDKAHKTPLHFGARAYQPAAVDLLLKAGAQVDAQDANGNTPLSDAVFESRGRGAVIRALLARGADKKLKNNYGVSPDDLAESISNYDVRMFLS